jgi:hypothetical protein
MHSFSLGLGCEVNSDERVKVLFPDGNSTFYIKKGHHSIGFLNLEIVSLTIKIAFITHSA